MPRKFVCYSDGYKDGYEDGRKEGYNDLKDKIQDYIVDLITARDLVATGAHPETNGPFGAAVADAQKTVLDNVISRLEEMMED